MKDTTLDMMLRLYAGLSAPRVRDQSGDVPGWVMVTVMTVALAIAVFTFAEEPLKALLIRAFDSVR